ncbi:MAG: hypothetical protein R3E96_04845 [Planctomycetota bacterium]
MLALRWIAREMVATGDLPKAGLGAWLQGHDTVAHRMADARAAGSVLEYHGYRIEYVAEGPMAGHLIALPARPGITGRVPYQLALPLRDGSRQD